MNGARGPDRDPGRFAGKGDPEWAVPDRHGADATVGGWIDARDGAPELVADPDGASSGGDRGRTVTDLDDGADSIRYRVDPPDRAVEAVGNPDGIARGLRCPSGRRRR